MNYHGFYNHMKGEQMRFLLIPLQSHKPLKK